MNTVNKVLLGALGVQAVLALATNWPSSGSSEPRDLLGFPVEDIQTISITGRKARDEVPLDPVKLTRTDAGWVITSTDDYPAKDDLVQPVLDAFGKLKVRTPVATSEASQANLEVAADAFTRMIEITAKDGTTRKLYVGGGQGKTAHVRVDGEKEIYQAEGVNAWSLSENANRYFDRDFLKVAIDTVQSVSIQRPGQPKIELVKAPEGTWTLNDPSAPALDPSATATFLSGLLTVRMIEPTGKVITPEMGLDGPGATVVTWTATDGDTPESAQTTTLSYRISDREVPDKTGRYYLKSDTSPWVVEVLKGGVTNALEKSIESLKEGAVIDIDAPAGAPPGHGAGGPSPGHGAGGPTPGHGAGGPMGGPPSHGGH